MRGYVRTPDWLVDEMVKKLFQRRDPKPQDTILDPGCGEGGFIEGILRYVDEVGVQPPQVLGIEQHPVRAEAARKRFSEHPEIQVIEGDFLADDLPPVDYVIGNPPYVSIMEIDPEEKECYRASYEAAVGRFDLYMLFLERAIDLLRDGGRLVFVTPEKFQYVSTAERLRRLLGAHQIEEVHQLSEDAFPGVTSYPSVTTILKGGRSSEGKTRVLRRSGERREVILPSDGRSWSPFLRGWDGSREEHIRLKDVAARISCGVATGADAIFVFKKSELPDQLQDYVRPTISGRQLGLQNRRALECTDVMVVPYDDQGDLLPEEELGRLGTFLNLPANRRKLEGRHCVREGGKKWYAFHDSYPEVALAAPKVLCKDITQEPEFWVDPEGEIVPRHSVYYIVPRPGVDLGALQEHLNGDFAKAWLEAHCQHAANGYLRLQSSVLKELPVPKDLGQEAVGQANLLVYA